MPMPPAKARSIRKACLARKLPLNPALSGAGRGRGNAFLTNPASQNVYLYLTDYVAALAESWFEKAASELSVLDWGCGKGHVTLLLKELGADVTPCDVDAGQGQAVIERAGGRIVPLDHEYLLPFNSGQFDVVVSFGVLEHVPSEVESLTEIRRVLTDAGLLFCFYVPYFLSWTQRLTHLKGARYHDRLYSKRRICDLTSAAGFQLLDVWHRQLLPKIHVRYPGYRLFEAVDQFLTRCSLLKYLATNIEFVACKK